MGTLGEEIKAARLRKNIELDAIAEKTHISKRHLENMEADRIDQLPGGELKWLMLRQYLKILELDEDSFILRYKKTVPGDSADSIELPRRRISSHKPLFRFLFLTAVTFSLMVLGGILLWREISSKRSEIRTAQDSLQSKPEIPLLTLPPTTTLPDPNLALAENTASPMKNPEQPSTEPSSEMPQPIVKNSPTVSAADNLNSSYALTMWIEFHAPCWVSVNVDGKQVTRQEFYRGEKLPFRANNQISLILGNAGGVSVQMNGLPLRKLGTIGEVKRFIFTPENYKEYQAESNTP